MKSKDQKREEAAERQAVHEGLSPLEKLSKASSRPGFSSREKGRILAEVAD